ncbi:DUF5691 domain-containing protein [uncultured Erythrobacter sp.]|uniref:DUF5691 domain-containing protein n=1 Tax=uncultured Erythrobacter sp. TaxID=263913 RepID=UPI002633E1A8|nr:DUF5691 domain-containing protein [uncultured Erythrobacter sp.]
MTPDAILGTMMQGTGRRPLKLAGELAEGMSPEDPVNAPRLMALAVQATRFDTPPKPASFDEAKPNQSAEKIVSEAARPLILRLVTGKGNPADDVAASAVARAIAAKGLRLHPFDMAKLAPFAAKHAETLGLDADQSEQAGAADCYWTGTHTLDADNWSQATPAIKSRFIAELRANDPAGARALVEEQLPLEKAPVRVRLINALATGLGSDDREFLETLTKDRAPTVKQAVTRLLARLPGTGAAAEQVEELVSRIKRGTVGLLRKRTTLKLELPATVRSPAAETDWLALNFGAVSNHALAEAFGMEPGAMLEAARDDGRLVCGIAFAACVERDWPLLSKISTNHAQDIWISFLQPGLSAFGLATDSERRDWIDAAIPRRFDPDRLDTYSLQRLFDAIEGPLPLAQARAIFDVAHRIRPDQSEALTAAIALTPAGGLTEFARILESRSPEITRRASLLAETLIRLDEGPSKL